MLKSLVFCFMLCPSFLNAAGGRKEFQREMWVAPPNDKVFMVYAGEGKKVDLYVEPRITSSKVGSKDLVPQKKYPLLRTVEMTVHPGAGIVQENIPLKGRTFGPTDYISSEDYYVQSKGQRISMEAKKGAMVTILSLDSREGTVTGYFQIDSDVLEISHPDDYLKCLPSPFEQQQGPKVEAWSKMLIGQIAGWFMHEQGAFHPSEY